ncbi:MAG: hypothetical protein Q9218_006955, partial [Villophora microphyllina]
MNTGWVAVNKMPRNTKSPQQRNLNASRPQVKELPQTQLNVYHNSHTILSEDRNRRDKTIPSGKRHQSRSRNPTPCPSTGLQQADATPATPVSGKRKHRSGKCQHNEPSDHCSSKKKRKRTNTINQKGVVPEPLVISGAVHTPTTNTGTDGQKQAEISSSSPKPARRKSAVPHQTPAQTSTAETVSSTALTFRGIQVPQSTNSDPSPFEEPATSDESVPEVRRKQPNRKVKPVLSIEHEVDPLNPNQPQCGWDEPMIYESAEPSGQYHTAGAQGIRKHLASLYNPFADHDPQAVASSSPPTSSSTSRYAPSTNTSVSLALSSPSDNHQQRGSRRESAKKVTKTKGRAIPLSDRSQSEEDTHPDMSRFKRELTAALEIKSSEIESRMAPNADDDLLPGDGRAFRKAEKKKNNRWLKQIERLQKHVATQTAASNATQLEIQKAMQILQNDVERALSTILANGLNSLQRSLHMPTNVRKPRANRSVTAPPNIHASTGEVGSLLHTDNEAFQAHNPLGARQVEVALPYVDGPQSATNGKTCPRPTTQESKGKARRPGSTAHQCQRSSHVCNEKSGETTASDGHEHGTGVQSLQSMAVGTTAATSSKGQHDSNSPGEDIKSKRKESLGGPHHRTPEKPGSVETETRSVKVSPAKTSDASRGIHPTKSSTTSLIFAGNKRPHCTTTAEIVAQTHYDKAQQSAAKRLCGASRSNTTVQPHARPPPGTLRPRMVLNGRFLKQSVTTDRPEKHCVDHPASFPNNITIPSSTCCAPKEALANMATSNPIESAPMRRQPKQPPRMHTIVKVHQTRTWSTNPYYREVSVPTAKVDTTLCTCSALPAGFREPGQHDPSISTWPGGKEDFLGLCKQVMNCRGHSDPMRSACRDIYDEVWPKFLKEKEGRLRRAAEEALTRCRSGDLDERTYEDALRKLHEFLADRALRKDRQSPQQRQPTQRQHSTVPAENFYGSGPLRPTSHRHPGLPVSPQAPRSAPVCDLEPSIQERGAVEGATHSPGRPFQSQPAASTIRSRSPSGAERSEGRSGVFSANSGAHKHSPSSSPPLHSVSVREDDSYSLRSSEKHTEGKRTQDKDSETLSKRLQRQTDTVALKSEPVASPLHHTCEAVYASEVLDSRAAGIGDDDWAAPG